MNILRLQTLDRSILRYKHKQMFCVDLHMEHRTYKERERAKKKIKIKQCAVSEYSCAEKKNDDRMLHFATVFMYLYVVFCSIIS